MRSQRSGDFRYLFRLAAGSYEAELVFAELQDPARAGARLFDVYYNGRLTLWNVDVAGTVGSGVLRQRLAATLDADGVIELEFVGRQGAALVNGIRMFLRGQADALYVIAAGTPGDWPWMAGSPLEQVWAGRDAQGTATSDDGKFALRAVAPGAQTVSLIAAGIATQGSAGASITLPVTAGRDHELRLYAAPKLASLSGEVVDIVTGAPVESAEVWYEGALTSWHTDENGRFSIPEFPVDRRRIFARAADYQAPGANDYVMAVLVTAGREGQYRIFLTPAAGQVEGNLLDSITGEAVPGARVWVGTRRRGVLTETDGRFMLKGLPVGKPVPIYAAREGYRAPGASEHVISVQCVAGRTARLHAYLQPTHGIVQGKVLDLVSGEPVARALVYAGSTEVSTTTDNLGQFRLRLLAGGCRIYVAAAGYITEAGHQPLVQLTVAAGKTTEFTLFLKGISGSITGQVLDSITLEPIQDALVYVDEGFANVVTDAGGRYRIAQSNREHNVYIRAVDYDSGREDGWVAAGVVEPDRAIFFNHMLQPTLQLVSFCFAEVPSTLELIAGMRQTVTAKVRNTGRREGGATVRLIVVGFLEQENTEWLAPGEESLFRFSLDMPEDALSADHQEVYFELEGDQRRRVLATIRGAEVAVAASLDKKLYSPGETAVLRLTVRNVSGGTHRVFTRAQLADFTQVSPVRELADAFEVEHRIPVDSAGVKLFCGVYLASGRALYLDAFYLPQEKGLATVVSEQQVYLPGERVDLRIALTDEGKRFFPGQAVITVQVRLVRADDAAEIVPSSDEPVPREAPLSMSLLLPAHMRKGTYLISWRLSAGDKSADEVVFIDVRGYTARFLEFLNDRTEYQRVDVVKFNAVLDLSHALPCRLDLKVVDAGGTEVGAATRTIALPAGRSELADEIGFETQSAGHHTLTYSLHAVPEGIEPLLLISSLQAIDVAGPVILALNTDRRRYRPGDVVTVTITARGEATVPLRLAWDSGTLALDEVAVLAGLRTITCQVSAPSADTFHLEAQLLGDTVSRMTAPVRVRF